MGERQSTLSWTRENSIAARLGDSTAAVVRRRRLSDFERLENAMRAEASLV
jgi:hypothetical protein